MTKIQDCFKHLNFEIRIWDLEFFNKNYPKGTDLFLVKSTLHPEGLLRARGVAPSAFRPLRKILDCSLP